MSQRYTHCHKQVKRDGLHFADAVSIEAAEQIVAALNPPSESPTGRAANERQPGGLCALPAFLAAFIRRPH